MSQRIDRDWLITHPWARRTIEQIANEYVQQLIAGPQPPVPLADMAPEEAEAWREAQLSHTRRLLLPAIDEVGAFAEDAAVLLGVPEQKDEALRQAGAIFHGRVDAALHAA